MMIDFVFYFSTAEDKVGYVVVDDHRTALAEFSGGPALPHGTYRVQQGALTRISEPSTDDSQAVVAIPEGQITT